jgi:hypothetical protein
MGVFPTKKKKNISVSPFFLLKIQEKKDKEARITPQALKGRLGGFGFPFSTLF